MSFNYDFETSAVWGDVPIKENTTVSEQMHTEDSLPELTHTKLEEQEDTPVVHEPKAEPETIQVHDSPAPSPAGPDKDLLEKERLSSDILKMQESLKALLDRVEIVQGEFNKMQSENKVLENYVSNLSSNVLNSR